MASSSTYVLKKNYRCDRSLQQFYTGGPFALGLAPGGDGEGGAEAEAFLACACGGEVRVVSSADASAIGEPVDGDSEAITALALSPDSRLLFAAGHSRLIRAWDLASRACIRSWKVSIELTCVSWCSLVSTFHIAVHGLVNSTELIHGITKVSESW
jgi:U3 small nucleolar RNA-associated protein 13